MQIQLAVSETHLFSGALTYLSRWSSSALLKDLFLSLCNKTQELAIVGRLSEGQTWSEHGGFVRI